jgi:hypothetical protein
MASRKNKGKKEYPRNPLEVIITRKAKEFLSAEKEYWKQRDSLRRSMKGAVEALSLKAGAALPDDISSTVWGLQDGVAFVRHKSVSGERNVQFRVLPITLAKWAETGLLVPVGNREISLARAGLIRGLGNLILIDCRINDIQIPYAEFSHMRYGDIRNTPAVERAILDFQLTFLGMQAPEVSETVGPPGPIFAEATIKRLQEIARQFEELLQGDSQEEILQTFLKEHPFVLHQSAESISKQKLGEDFVTDFVLAATTNQGPNYILVELERANHQIMTKDYALASPVTHAIKQTRDWDVWLEKNKAYVQNKLPGFETPRYLVVIGRSADFTEDQKAYLRSYNREFKNIELLSYDDVLARFQSTIKGLGAMLSK